MERITAVIVATNEESRIGPAIQSVRPWVDGVLVVDGGSSDGTADVARSNGARVVHRTWDGFVSSKRAATALAGTDLVFALDADERVDAELGAALRSAPGATDVRAWAVRRINYLDGRPLRASGWYPDARVRLFDRRSARWQGRDPHDLVCCGGPIGRLPGHLHHDPERTTADYREATTAHAERAARAMVDGGVRPGPWSPWLHGGAHLVRKVTSGRCWLDGRRGWTVARTGAAGAALKYRRARELGR